MSDLESGNCRRYASLAVFDRDGIDAAALLRDRGEKGEVVREWCGTHPMGCQ